MPRQKHGEVMPLLPTAGRPSSGNVYQLTNLEMIKVTEKEFWDKQEEDEDDEEEDDKILYARKTKSTSLVLNDTILTIIHYIQVFCILMSMGLRWPWPYNWMLNGRYVFLCNLDVWEFMKVQTNGSYKSVQNYNTNTGLIPFPYWYILAGWAGLLFLLLVAYIIAYIIISTKKNPYMFIQLARLLRAYIIMAQLLAIPFGIVIARLFHCNTEGELDTDNGVLCIRGIHWAYMAPALAIAILFYILYPVWLVRKTKSEMLNMTKDRHEGYLQLKEIEYCQGLDVLWMVSSFHIFSSFKKRGAHFRAAIHVMIFVILCVYAGLFSHPFAQGLTIVAILLAMFITFIIIRPYRVAVFNLYLIFCYLCLVSNCMMGALVASFDAFSLRTVWLTPSYLIIILSIINGIWAIFTIVFIVYLLIRTCGYQNCCNVFWKEPLWPTMTPKGLDKLSHHTRKYVKSILRARYVLERCVTMHPMFAPAHELSRHIHIINAYLREAEYLQDPMHGSLWDLVDDLIETHERIAPKSLFAESVKTSIRYTAKDLMRMMPAFVRRLAQREYDFILVHPVKKKLLLKMYIMGLFLNGRRDKINRERMNAPKIDQIWNNRRRLDEFEVDDGYYEEMYPMPEEKPTYRPTTTVSVMINDDQEIDDDVAIQEAEQWAANHPLSAQGQTNPAYQEDDLMLMVDTDSVNLSQMLDGIPSPPSTGNNGYSTNHRGLGDDRPTSPGSRSVRSQSRQGTLTPRPESGTTRSRSVTPRLGSLASLRPGSSNAHRPTSPRSLDGEEGNSTPLPGQIDDPPDFGKHGESKA